jgi:hypothetical protein
MGWVAILDAALADFQPLTILLKDGRSLTVESTEDIEVDSDRGTVEVFGEPIDPSLIAAIGPPVRSKGGE